MLTGQNGILNRASEAKEATELAQQDENEKMKEYDNVVKEYTRGNLPTGEGTKPYWPDITKFEKVDGTDLNSGLVIREESTGNEYVWVEVPKTKNVYKKSGLDITAFTSSEYENIETDLRTYTNDYRNGTTYDDIYCEDSTSGWFKNEIEYNEMKQKMLKSVYQNGGFWVGRYEAGIEKDRKSKEDSTTIPLSKANLYPYNYVTRTQAKVLAEQVESGNYTSSLMFGVQWDLILKYIETKNAATQEELKSNSTTIGNYANNLWNITNASVKYFIYSQEDFIACPYQKNSSESVLLTTGADKNFSLMNIYDLAGNVWEWTLEKNPDNGSPCAFRGGSYIYGGADRSVGFRNYYGILDSVQDIGFRITLF